MDLLCNDFVQYIHNGEPTHYGVNRFGDIKNLNTNKIIKPRPNWRGYLMVGIYKNDGSHLHLTVHRMVATTFIGNHQYTNPLQVNHIDGVKTNNYFENLEWVTPSQNIKHAFDSGLKHGIKGNNHPVTVYTDESIIEACEYLNQGYTPKETAMLTNIPLSYLYTIIRGESRKHIIDEYLDMDNINYNDGVNRIRYTDEIKQQVFDLYERGYSVEFIRDKVGLRSTHSVYGLVNRNNIHRLQSSTTIERVDCDESHD